MLIKWSQFLLVLIPLPRRPILIISQLVRKKAVHVTTVSQPVSPTNQYRWSRKRLVGAAAIEVRKGDACKKGKRIVDNASAFITTNFSDLAKNNFKNDKVKVWNLRKNICRLLSQIFFGLVLIKIELWECKNWERRDIVPVWQTIFST